MINLSPPSIIDIILSLSTIGVFPPIQSFSAFEEPFGVADMRAVAEAEQGVVEAGVALADAGEKSVQPESNADARKQHGIELYVDRCAQYISRPPHPYDQYIEQDFRAGGADMREVEREEQVVQVRLVGRERRPAVQHSHGHYTDGIEHGYGEHRERERHQPQIFVSGCFRRHITVQAVDDEIGHDCSHQQRAPVADEHFGLQSENVVAQERYQGSDAGGGEESSCRPSERGEKYAEDGADEDAVARAQSVHPVDQVDGVDDAHAGKDGQTYGKPFRQPADAPQSVEVVYAVSRIVHQRKDCKDLYEYPKTGRQPQYVIHDSDIQHHRHDA